MLKLGDIEVRSVLDISGKHASIFEFLPDASPEKLAPHRSWLEPTALCPETQRIILPVQTYYVKTPHHRILIDTCVGCDKNNPDYLPWHQRRDEGWLQRLAQAGVLPHEIDYVLCTHLHADHCGWNTRLRDGRWVPTFPNAKYVISSAEHDFSSTAGGVPYRESVLPIVQAGQAHLVDSDYALDDQVSLEDTSGHTPGHVAVNLTSQGQTGIMAGDLIHSPIQCVFPDWNCLYDEDPSKAAATRRRFLDKYADTDTWVLTAHFPPPSYGHIVRSGSGFRFRYSDQNASTR